MHPDSYHEHLDIMGPLTKCRALPELRALLASLAADGQLAQLAGSLRRNPLSLVTRRPPVEPCTEVCVCGWWWWCWGGGAGGPATGE